MSPNGFENLRNVLKRGSQGPRRSTQQADAASDDEMSIPGLCDLDGSSDASLMPDDEFEKELLFCNVLLHWSPWDAPTKELVDAMGALPGKSDATRCTLRSQVVAELAIEKAQMSVVPKRDLYARGVKYRLKQNKPLMINAYDPRQFLNTHGLLTLGALEKRLSKPCGRGNMEHTCLDAFRRPL